MSALSFLTILTILSIASQVQNPMMHYFTANYISNMQMFSVLNDDFLSHFCFMVMLLLFPFSWGVHYLLCFAYLQKVDKLSISNNFFLSRFLSIFNFINLSLSGFIHYYRLSTLSIALVWITRILREVLSWARSLNHV